MPSESEAFPSTGPHAAASNGEASGVGRRYALAGTRRTPDPGGEAPAASTSPGGEAKPAATTDAVSPAWLDSPLHAALVHVTEVAAATCAAPVAAAAIMTRPPETPPETPPADPPDPTPAPLPTPHPAPLSHATIHPGHNPAASHGSGGHSVPWAELASAVARWPHARTGLLAALRRLDPPPPGIYLDHDLQALTRVAPEDALGTTRGPWWPRWHAAAVLPLNPHAWAVVALLHEREQPSRDHLRQRLDDLRPAAARRLAQACDQQWRRPDADDPVRRPLADRLATVSRTESEVLRHLLRGGVTERQVAHAMHRSPHTIHVHVKSIYRKLSVSSRKELLRLLHRHRLDVQHHITHHAA